MTAPGRGLISAPRNNEAYRVQRVLLAADYPVANFQNDLARQPKKLYGFHMWGLCPNCGHPTNGLVAAKYLADDDWTAFTSPAAEDAIRASANVQTDLVSLRDDAGSVRRRQDARRNVVVFRCACNHTHNPPPSDERFGCGSEWLLKIDYLPDDTEAPVIVETVADAEAARYWEASEDITASVADSASTAQTMSKTWTTVLASLVGLLTLAGIIGGRDTIQSLPDWAQALLGLFAFIALILQGATLYWGNVASIGFPQLRNSLKPHQLRDADIQPLIDADAIVTRLHRALLAAGLSVVAAGAAFAIFLFVPATHAPGDVKLTYSVNHIMNETACGQLVTDETGGTATFTPDGGTGSTYKIQDITAITPC